MTKDQKTAAWVLWNEGHSTKTIADRLLVAEYKIDSHKNRMTDQVYFARKQREREAEQWREKFRC